MRSITHRLKAILAILLGAEDPVPVKEIADDLKISRRTVFRELSSTESVLQSFGLSLGSKPGEGIYINGAERGKDSLRRMIRTTDGNGPTDRADRQARLMLTLLVDGRLDKLMKYADAFTVSVATISNDLDEIEARLRDFGIGIARRSGAGVTMTGEELPLRMAILHAVHDHPELWDTLGAAAAAPDLRAAGHDKWMTPQSAAAFARYLGVAAARMKAGAFITASGRSELFAYAARTIAGLLVPGTVREIPDAEADALSLVLHGCSLNLAVDDIHREENRELVRLAHEMIDHYRSPHTPLLQHDEALLDGLVSYLSAARIRLEHKLEIHDPLSEQMAAVYPDIMEKTRAVAAPLRRLFARVPDSEVSLIATHFGAAQSRLNDHFRREREVRVGVVCVHGMGTSYLLASQARKAFSGEARFEVGSWTDPEGWLRFDFLISTTPIDHAEIPVVEVSLLMTDGDIARVRAAIETAARRAGGKTGATSRFTRHCETIESLASDVKGLLTRYRTVAAEAGMGFRELAGAVAAAFGERGREREAIFHDLMAREDVTTQVLRELDLIFLHCRSAGVAGPVFGLAAPPGGRFTDPALAPCRAGIALLIPPDASPGRMEMAGAISASLVTNSIFLEDILHGDAEAVRAHLEGILERFLLHYVNEELDTLAP